MKRLLVGNLAFGARSATPALNHGSCLVVKTEYDRLVVVQSCESCDLGDVVCISAQLYKVMYNTSSRLSVCGVGSASV